MVHGLGSRVYLILDPDSIGGGPYRLSLDYSDVKLVKAVIVAIADDPTLTVDNDFGPILPEDKFVARCKADESWDWRK